MSDTQKIARVSTHSSRPGANIRLLVIGRGGENKYRKMAQSPGITDAVTFAGMQVDGLERYYRVADVFVMLSKFDTFGMVMLAAMAAGLPVIISPNVGAKDLVEEGINGFVLPEHQDAETAAERIVLLSDTARRETMGIAAAQSAALHDWEKLAEKMVHLYQAVFSESSSRNKKVGSA